jgi:hypothetical protein
MYYNPENPWNGGINPNPRPAPDFDHTNVGFSDKFKPSKEGTNYQKHGEK